MKRRNVKMWIVIFLGGALLTGYALYRQAVRESGSVVTADIRFGQSGKICFLPHTAGENIN